MVQWRLVSQDRFGSQERAREKVGWGSNISSVIAPWLYCGLDRGTCQWCAACGVPACSCCAPRLTSNAMLSQRCGTGWARALCHRDPDEMVFIDPS